MTQLTAMAVRKAGTGRHGDGRGLYLVVSDSGSRKWVLRLQTNGKRRDFGLGSGSNVSLAEARDAAEDVRRIIRAGDDPVAERKRKRHSLPTFREAAVMVHQENLPAWKNKKHAQQWISTLETYAYPHFGDTPVNQIDGAMIRDALIEIWLTIPETARRVRQRIGTVLDFAHAKGWREAEAPLRSVTRGLPKQIKTREHLPALPWKEVPEFIANMEDVLIAGLTVRLAIEFTILTAARSGEVRGATWSEFDLDDKAWRIPAERMKAARPHRVPLSDRAIEILETMSSFRQSSDPNSLVFEGQKAGRPLSDMTLTMPIRRAKLPITMHGFRSTFRDWCSDAAEVPREVAEACLAHTVKNAVEAAYARSDHFEKRREVMDHWAVFCNGTDTVGITAQTKGTS
jgi:integrase